MCIQDSRRSSHNLYLSYRVYTRSEIPVDIAEITERVQVLRNLFLYGSTCKYYGTYTDLTELILVYRTYSYLTEFILVLRIPEYS